MKEREASVQEGITDNRSGSF